MNTKKVYNFSADFLSEVVSYALAIAQKVRNENHLQPCDVLYAKFEAEFKELQEAPDPIDELPDVIYYALCLTTQGENYCLSRLEVEILPQYSYSQQQLEAATRAKYSRRASGAKKDIVAEHEAMIVAMRHA